MAGAGGARGWAALAVATVLLGGCGASGTASNAERDPTTTAAASPTTTEAERDEPTTTVGEGRGDDIPDEPEAPAGPTSDLVTVRDPVNDAFTVAVPDGWDNLVYSTVDGQVHREVVSSVSPDGATVLFLSDPKIPSYWNPDQADPITEQFAEWSTSMDLAYYDAAPSYFQTYVDEKFGQLADFAFEGIEENTTTEQSLQRAAADAGVQFLAIDAVDVRFSFTDDDGVRNEALVIGTTLDSGPFWQADVVGLATAGRADDYLDMLSAMARSKQTNPDFIALQDQRHQQTMALIAQRTEEMTRQHEANMAWIQDSANAHQQRMASIWAANDASVASFYDRMASSDVSHRSFLNYINDERTVQTTDGQRFQVDDSYQRYWVNPTTGEYAGGDVGFGVSQLRDLGLDPGSYQEVEIVPG
ncbi:MAG: hypothetical protein R2702_11770 [Acidimicrobiales bacterium]